MKKVLLTAALGCMIFSGANAADPPHTLSNTFGVQVNDYIYMIPNNNGYYQGILTNGTFHNTSEMMAGIEVGPTDFTVDASRSWHATYAASDFRNAGAAPPISEYIPVELIYTIEPSSSDPMVTPAYVGYQPSEPNNVPKLMVNGVSGVGHTYSVNSRITPGNILNNPLYNMSGPYLTNVTIIASLD